MATTSWEEIGARLQEQGFFTRICRVEGFDNWIEVCKPNEDVSVEEVQEALKGFKAEVIQIDIWDRCDNNWVRVKAV